MTMSEIRSLGMALGFPALSANAISYTRLADLYAPKDISNSASETWVVTSRILASMSEVSSSTRRYASAESSPKKPTATAVASVKYGSSETDSASHLANCCVLPSCRCNIAASKANLEATPASSFVSPSLDNSFSYSSSRSEAVFSVSTASLSRASCNGVSCGNNLRSSFTPRRRMMGSSAMIDISIHARHTSGLSGSISAAVSIRATPTSIDSTSSGFTWVAKRATRSSSPDRCAAAARSI